MISFKKSNIFFNKVKKIIPLASQTFSKSYLFLDEKFSPLFCTHAKKQFIYDLDGNKFLDFVSGLGSISIGYGIKAIDKKVKKKIDSGVTYSLSHKLEYEVSKLILKHFPHSDMIRFGKNGSDVTTAAIRLARYYTARDDIAVCGYHGWHDWYISKTNMNNGIPYNVSKNIEFFDYNNYEMIEKIFKKKKLAAVIIEPISYIIPEKNFLIRIKKLCKKHKTLLIFDEICTGFRLSSGGAQKILKVFPDLTTLGKGIANGYPISALIGKKAVMKNMEKIFYSGTFLGETVSLTACKETILFQKKNSVIKKNFNLGKILFNKIKKLITKYKLQNSITISGHNCWLFLRYINKSKNKNKNLKEYIFQELIQNKILFLGAFNISFSHTLKDILFFLKSLDSIFSNINKIGVNDLKKHILIKSKKNLLSIRRN